MGIFSFIKNSFFLVLGIIIAILGLQFGLYGLIINILGDSLQEVSVNELYQEGAGTKRYVDITDGLLWDLGLTYIDGNGKTTSYLYAVTLSDTIATKKVEVAIVESAEKISDLKQFKVVGQLKPFWHSLDEEIINTLNYEGFKIAKNNYYIDVDAKPRKWYWNLIILFVSGLFIFRLIEAILKGIKGKKQKVTS